MDFLQCRLCCISYDEDGHRPHIASCNHELCRACLKALIKNGTFKCPKCYQDHNANVPDDLLVNLGLIDAIRAFKTINLKASSLQATQPSSYVATNADYCKVHCKPIGYKCLKCQIWLCNTCLDSHSTLTGCSPVSSSEEVDSMKEKNNKDVDMLLTIFDEDVKYMSTKIQNYNDKIKELSDKRINIMEEAEKKFKDILEETVKLGEEIKKLHNILTQGNSQREDLVMSTNNLNATNSPYAVMDRIDILTQTKQSLHSWSTMNLGTVTLHGLQLELEQGQHIYTSMVINVEKRHAKLSHHEGRLLLHSFLNQTVVDGCITKPFDSLKKIIPSEASLVFLELSQQNVLQGHVLVRLDKNLPKIMKNFVEIVTGQRGQALIGKSFGTIGKDYINAAELRLNHYPVNLHKNAISTAKKGELLGWYGSGHLEGILFYIDSPPKTRDFGSSWCVIGNVIDNLEVIQNLSNNTNKIVKVSDCGLVIEKE